LGIELNEEYIKIAKERILSDIGKITNAHENGTIELAKLAQLN
jgi:hypothetical protein